MEKIKKISNIDEIREKHSFRPKYLLTSFNAVKLSQLKKLKEILKKDKTDIKIILGLQ